MRVLAVGAHPDDLEYSCGGTLIRHAQKGDEVYLLIATDGQQGGDTEVRRKEQMEAARIIGAKEVFWAGYPDTRFICDRTSINVVEEVIKKVKPDTVYTHFADDTHQDHRNLAQVVVPAARSVTNLLFFEGYSAQNFVPTVFVNIVDEITLKLAALNAHVSQIEKTNIEDRSIADIALAAAGYRGIQGRVTYAEGFTAGRYFIDI